MFGPERMACMGDARVMGIRQRWWAVALPDGTLEEGWGSPPFELDVQEGAAVEVASRHGRSYIWTRKQAGLAVRGFDGEGFVDDSAGYHARHTTWFWSAGSGRLADGRRVAWNLVDGVHDSPEASERTVWVDGEPHEVGPVEFAEDLSRVGDLAFREWPDSARVDDTNALIFKSRYRQPFGSFSGTLPGGLELAEGYGVMESHDVTW